MSVDEPFGITFDFNLNNGKGSKGRDVSVAPKISVGDVDLFSYSADEANVITLKAESGVLANMTALDVAVNSFEPATDSSVFTFDSSTAKANLLFKYVGYGTLPN